MILAFARITWRTRRKFPPCLSVSRVAPFQFAFDGALFPFSYARPAFDPLFRLPNRHGQRTPAEFVQLKAERRAMLPRFIIGVLPLCAAPYDAAHSPRFLPEPASRGAPYQPAFDGAWYPLSHARPAYDPASRTPNRHGQRTPAESAQPKAER